MRNRHGFTLVELAVVVAFAGILAAIAIPRYSDHLIRERVAEAMVVAKDAQAAVAEAAAVAGGLAHVSAIDYTYEPSAETQHVATVWIESGVIKIATRYTGANVDPQLRLMPFQGAPGEPLVWSCALENAARWEHLPADCQG